MILFKTLSVLALKVTENMEKSFFGKAWSGLDKLTFQ